MDHVTSLGTIAALAAGFGFIGLGRLGYKYLRGDFSEPSRGRTTAEETRGGLHNKAMALVTMMSREGLINTKSFSLAVALEARCHAVADRLAKLGEVVGQPDTGSHS